MKSAQISGIPIVERYLLWNIYHRHGLRTGRRRSRRPVKPRWDDALVSFRWEAVIGYVADFSTTLCAHP